MNLKFSIKFRALFMTFGTATGTVPLSVILNPILAVIKAKGIAGISPDFVTAELKPQTLYSDHGVTVEITS